LYINKPAWVFGDAKKGKGFRDRRSRKKDQIDSFRTRENRNLSGMQTYLFLGGVALSDNGVRKIAKTSSEKKLKNEGGKKNN